MAFSFVVETGDGDPDATSYVSIQFADDYIDANSFASADWLALSDENKQRLLIRASKYLDNIVQWDGEKVDEDSGLRWPRSGVYDRDGFLIAEDDIPQALKEAVAEMANYLRTSDWTAPSDTAGLREVQVDVIDIKFDSNFKRGNVPPIIAQILEGLGTINTGRRPAFKPIVRS